MFIRRRDDFHSESPPSQKLFNLIALAALAALAVCLLILARPAHTETGSSGGEPPPGEKEADTLSAEQKVTRMQRAEAISPRNHSAAQYQYEGPGDPAVRYLFSDPFPAVNGRDLTYFIGVANVGAEPSSGVTLTDELPSNVDFVSARAYTVEFDENEDFFENEIEGACSESGGTVTCDLGDLPGGGAAKYVDIVVTPTERGTLENTATVSGTPNDKATNDSQTEETRVINAEAISSDGPLTEISTTESLNCQVTHEDDFEGAFSPGNLNANCGTFVAVGNEIFGPDIFEVGETTPYTPISQDTRGSGIEADPHEIETVVALGDTGLTLTQTDSYVEGDEFYATEAALTNSGSAPVDAILYHAGDCKLNGDESGFGDTGESPGSVQCRSADFEYDEETDTFNEVPGDRVLEMTPTAPDSQYYEDFYVDVWGKVGLREPFEDSVNGNYTDNGEGLSWNVTVPANDSAARSLQTRLTGVPEVADLSIFKYGRNVAAVGEDFTYFLDIYNDGPSAAANTIVTDDLPENVDFVSAKAYRYEFDDDNFGETEIEGACSEADGTVTCDLGDLEESFYGFVEIIVSPTQLGNITNTASVASETADTFLGDNEDSVETEVVPPSADLFLSKYTSLDDRFSTFGVGGGDPPEDAVVGQRFTYYLYAYNDGPSPATGTVVTDTLPAGVEFVSAKAYSYDEENDFFEVEIFDA